ncbi:hypothetical protein SKAU_G00092420 [Synaphobranchus kaupii]|uniref:Uncharacterized protein n=1 Tax=Synaphobranchus kaupii TaxID=118154 RepID=A0A9Q1J6A8_SYNKA|nr:hypothetical protein SKAU_G00092420 [Synaphobranchus kaupii]
MRCHRHRGCVIGPRLSRVTKAAGGAGATPGWVLGLINARIPRGGSGSSAPWEGGVGSRPGAPEREAAPGARASKPGRWPNSCFFCTLPAAWDPRTGRSRLPSLTPPHGAVVGPLQEVHGASRAQRGSAGRPIMSGGVSARPARNRPGGKEPLTHKPGGPAREGLAGRAGTSSQSG